MERAAKKLMNKSKF